MQRVPTSGVAFFSTDPSFVRMDIPDNSHAGAKADRLMFPPSLTAIPHRLTSRNGVHVYGAAVPPSIWQRVTFPQATILILGETGNGLARWLGPSGKLLEDLHPEDVWMIPPGVETTCEFHTVSDVLLLGLAPDQLARALSGQAHRLAGQAAITPLADYCRIEPILQDLHFVVHRESRGLSAAQNGRRVDLINAALVLARQLWTLHYVALRTTLGNLSPREAVNELTGGPLP